MDVDAAPYPYEPLKPGESRLLYVEDHRSGPKWTLRKVPLFSDHAPPFVALSYAWGDLVKSFPFICSGHKFSIHANLRDALLNLAERCVASKTPIWIDAICINQADEVEKFAQVRGMNDVYGRAKEVWAWLGPSNDLTEDAINVISSLARMPTS
jgi:hypothetical protein